MTQMFSMSVRRLKSTTVSQVSRSFLEKKQKLKFLGGLFGFVSPFSPVYTAEE